jgi:hypothetical protein
VFLEGDSLTVEVIHSTHPFGDAKPMIYNDIQKIKFFKCTTEGNTSNTPNRSTMRVTGRFKHYKEQYKRSSKTTLQYL